MTSQATANPFVKPGGPMDQPRPEELHHIACGCTIDDDPRKAMCGAVVDTLEPKPTSQTRVCVVCRDLDDNGCPRCGA